MKRFIKYILLISIIAAFSTGCDEDTTEDISRVTYFPEFEIEGDDPFFIDINEAPDSYEDPGVTVTEGDEEIDYETEHNVDLETAGYYTVNYSATNKDDIKASASREVVVGCTGDDDFSLSVTGDAVSSLGYSYEVSMEKTSIGKFKFNDITGAFTVEIPGEVGILCGEVVTGSSDYGMYDSATYDEAAGEIVITWSYAPSGLAGETTTIPVTED